MSAELDFWCRDGLLVCRRRFTECDEEITLRPYIEGNQAAIDELYFRVWGCYPGEGMPRL